MELNVIEKVLDFTIEPSKYEKVEKGDEVSFPIINYVVQELLASYFKLKLTFKDYDDNIYTQEIENNMGNLKLHKSKVKDNTIIPPYI